MATESRPLQVPFGRTGRFRPSLLVMVASFFLSTGDMYAQSPPDYMCTILDMAAARDDGRIGSTDWTEAVANELEGTQFLVDRLTGRMMGSTLSNHNAFGTPEVVDHGSFEQAYKVVTVYQPRAAVAYLQVEEYVDESEKPFLFLNWRVLYTGTCIHVFG